MVEEIAEGVVKEYDQPVIEENDSDDDDDYSIASRISGEKVMEFVLEEVEGEEQTIRGKVDGGN